MEKPHIHIINNDNIHELIEIIRRYYNIQNNIDNIVSTFNYYNTYYYLINIISNKKNNKEVITEKYTSIMEYIDDLLMSYLNYLNVKVNLNNIIKLIEDEKDKYYNEKQLIKYIKNHHNFVINNEHNKLIDMLEFIYLYINIYNKILHEFKNLNKLFLSYLNIIYNSRNILYNLYKNKIIVRDDYEKIKNKMTNIKIYIQEIKNVMDNIEKKNTYIHDLQINYSKYYELCDKNKLIYMNDICIINNNIGNNIPDIDLISTCILSNTTANLYHDMTPKNCSLSSQLTNKSKEPIIKLPIK